MCIDFVYDAIVCVGCQYAAMNWRTGLTATLPKSQAGACVRDADSPVPVFIAVHLGAYNSLRDQVCRRLPSHSHLTPLTIRAIPHTRVPLQVDRNGISATRYHW